MDVLRYFPSVRIQFPNSVSCIFSKVKGWKILQTCYSGLDDFFQHSPDKESSVLNITGGNRLMGFAALLIAQTYKIKAVYRDFNAGKELLAAISFDDGKRRSETIWINRCPEELRKRIKLEELLKNG